MKMAILELEYKNIRKITALKLPFTKADGSVISNNFIMMANGTGKTTTMELIKGLFDGTAAGWTASKVRSFAPTLTEADTGEFSITVKFDDRQYKYFLSMNYKDGTVQVETSAPPKGREAGLRLPESIRGIFTPEFVRRFVFDGEQAAKSMDSSSNEADETIRYLYRLDELDEILAANQRILTEIQNAEGKRGTSSSLSNLRTRQSDIDAIRAKLRARCEKLREEIAAFEAEKVEKEKQRQELDKSYEKLNQEKNDILKEQQKNRGEIDVKITSILGIIKSPYLLSESLCARMFELGNSMKKLKLPKTIAKDFFTELASADRCVCDRCIGERERTAILKRADQYLGSDQQSVLNAVKSSLMDSVYDERLKKAFEELEELRAQANRLDTRFKTNEEKLIKAGGEKARELQERIEELIRLISIARDELERIESKDENDASLTEENNLHKADQKFKYYEQNKFIQFDVYYCCALIGMAAGQIDEDTSELKDLVERYPVQYRDCKAQIAGLLVASEARRLGIDTQSSKLEQIMLQYLSNNDTLLSEDGIKTLNAYALKGYRLITDYPLFDKPTSREEFLDAFNVAMQFYEKKDS